MKLLAKSQSVVSAMLAGGKTSTEPNIKRSIDATGSLRMLSQKAAKEFCLALDDGNDRKQTESLGKTMVLFQERLNKIISGSEEDGFPTLTNSETLSLLSIVKSQWRGTLSVMAKLYLGQGASEEAINSMANESSGMINVLNASIKQMSKGL